MHNENCAFKKFQFQQDHAYLCISVSEIGYGKRSD